MGTTLSYSNIPVYEESVRIDSINFICDSVVAVGDTINLEIKLTSFVSDSATIALTRYSGLKIIDEDSTKKGLLEYVKLDTNQSVTKNYKIVATGIIPTKIQFFIKTFHSIPEVTDLSSFTQELLPVDNGQGFGIPVRVASDCVQSLWMDDNDDECDNYTFLTQQCEATFIDSNSVDISGSVSFEDWNAPGIDSSHPVQIKSPYTEVWLFFKPINNYNKQLIHPREYSPIDGPIEGIHYAKCDDNGVFHFNFKYSKEKLDCNQSYEILLLVAKENEAIWLESPTNHIKVYGIYNNYRRPTPSHIRFFKELGEGNIVNINGNYIGTWNFNLNFGDGSIFRHFTLSRKFLKRIYQTENLTAFGITQIEVLAKSTFPTSNYDFSRINMLWRQHCESKDLSHEYGHYFDDKKIHFFNEGFPYVASEGFATFFSWIYRIWLNTNYQDNIDNLADNCEIGPYCNGTSLIVDKNNNLISNITEARYFNINKVFWSMPSKLFGYNMCRWASLLYNIYDGKNMGEFGYSKYDGKENDDVDNQSTKLMNYLITQPSYNSLTFLQNYINFYYANDPLMEESLMKLYNFLDFSSSENRNLSNLEQFVKSPNLDFSYSIENNNLLVNFGNTNSYSFGSTYKSFYNLNPLNLNIKRVNLGYNFDNEEDGVKVYQYIGSNWELIQFIDKYQERNCTLDISNDQRYKISTYKIMGGDSYKPLIYPNFSGKKSFNFIDDIINNNDVIKFISTNKITLSLDIPAVVFMSTYDLNGKLIHSEKYSSLKKGDNIIKFFIERSGLYILNFVIIYQDGNIIVKNFKIYY